MGSPKSRRPEPKRRPKRGPVTGGCGMSRPKMVSVSGGGGGGAGPGRSRACTPTGLGSASGPGRDSGSRPGPPRAFGSLASRGILGSLRDGGRRSELGRTPFGELRVTQRPCPPRSSLCTRLPYSHEVRGREVRHRGSHGAWPGWGPFFPFSRRCEREARCASVSPAASPLYTPPPPRSPGHAPRAGPRQMAGT